MPYLSDIKDAFFLDCGLSYNDPKTITASTAANPVVITAAAHGFVNGDEVDIADIEWVPTTDIYGTDTQPAQLNGERFTVANKTNDTFELTGENGAAFRAYFSGGTVRKAVTTVSGLWHLEGEAVTVLADGIEITGHTVTNGAITLASKASRIHIGFNYVAELETLNVEAPTGTIQGKKKKIAEVTVRVERSRGLLIGPRASQLVPVKDAEFVGLESENGLLTGDLRVTLKPSWNSNGRLLLRQRAPLPLTILAVIPDVVTEDSRE